MKFPFYRQPDIMDCGPTCLRMIAKFHGRSVSLEKLRLLSETNRLGTNLLNLSRSAETIGFRTLGVKIDFEALSQRAPLPCICHWNDQHFVVVHKIKKEKVYVADPAHGMLTYSVREFLDNWIGKHADKNTEEGLALMLHPTPNLSLTEDDDNREQQGFSFLFKYLKGNYRLLTQLGIGLLLVSLLQLIIPFLTQSIVDIGIQNRDISFLYLILIGQLFVFVGRIAVEAVRGWILLHLSARTNIMLVSDFLVKLMKLPISYFDVKLTGDIMQRIGDHKRIEHLLTNQSLNVLFSLFNFVVFGIVLAIYSVPVFLIFLVGVTLYFSWVGFFMKKRKDLDHKKFTQLKDDQTKIVELINGMQEIKLNNAERQKRWSWEQIQIKLYKIQIKSLRLEQFQSLGSSAINELKNLLIGIYTAILVVNGEMTLGMMLSVSYIVGSLNTPIGQFLGFIFSLQDAKISIERLSEIHNKDDEEKDDDEKLSELPQNKTISIENVSFRYAGFEDYILKNVSFQIPANKVTAIVGSSGSGKTTLMKLLLRFYEPETGKIKVGETDLNGLTQYVWRHNCGSVMQEGFLFNDTIAKNIAVADDRINKELLNKAIHVANIQDLIERLPLTYNTKLGAEGMGISTGQKQRILIARAVYKNPDFLFFDEATSALDANNERVIMENLEEFFQGRTAVVIAHRLSTVKNADQIVVLDKGEVIEIGTHSELLDQKGNYYNLVKNQLDLEKIEAQTL